VITQAAESPQLWRNLAGGISPIYPMRSHVEELVKLYDELLASEPVAIGAAS
jgi:hypothetical protein